eukprot:1431708-Amphidinium_carterae.1
MDQPGRHGSCHLAPRARDLQGIDHHALSSACHTSACLFWIARQEPLLPRSSGSPRQPLRPLEPRRSHPSCSRRCVASLAIDQLRQQLRTTLQIPSFTCALRLARREYQNNMQPYNMHAMKRPK